MPIYAVLDFQKCKSDDLNGISQHNNRDYSADNLPKNIYPERTKNNRHLIGDGKHLKDLVMCYIEDKREGSTQRKGRDGKMKTVHLKVRKDAVLCVNVVLSASPEYFSPPQLTGNPGKVAQGEYDEAALEQWVDANMAYLQEEFGDRVVYAELHLDEKTPHIHASIVPITDGVLSAKKMFYGHKQILSQHHDRYHKFMSPLGIERGVEGSMTQNRIKRAKTELECRGEELANLDLKIMQEEMIAHEHKDEIRDDVVAMHLDISKKAKIVDDLEDKIYDKKESLEHYKEQVDRESKAGLRADKEESRADQAERRGYEAYNQGILREIEADKRAAAVIKAAEATAAAVIKDAEADVKKAKDKENQYTQKNNELHSQLTGVASKLEKSILNSAKAVKRIPKTFDTETQETASESLKMQNLKHSIINDDSYLQRALKMIDRVSDFFGKALGDLHQYIELKKANPIVQRNNVNTFTPRSDLGISNSQTQSNEDKGVTR